MSPRPLDVICLGRSSVDLYGEQIGGRLEDVQSFAKYVGGCPTNIAVGTARLGLKSGLVTRVGDEQLGRFIVETLNDEGVDTSNITFDPDRLTALVILAIRDRQTFPHIFYRPDCADMALAVEHIDPNYIASAKVLLVTGTHFSQPGVEAASRAAMIYAREQGTRIVLDIDYRPVLWGLTGHAAGENRFIADAAITARLQSLVCDCDLIVGTEEEIHIAGGSEDTRTALRAIRDLSEAVIVLKRGSLGCIVFDDAIPDDLEDGISAVGKPVTVMNTLGAGDGFLSGFLRGWIRGETLETCCRLANAAGALVVSRNGCAPAMPSWEEMQAFLGGGPVDLERLHRVTTRSRQWSRIHALAFDHRSQFEDLADRHQAGHDRIGAFKGLIAEALCQAAPEGGIAGAIVDAQHGENALFRLSGNGMWIARPVEQPGSRPLRFESGENIGLTLRSWPREHVVKCLVSYHPDDPEALRTDQLDTLHTLYQACLTTDHDLLIEVIPPDDMPRNASTVARAVADMYGREIYPDWWKLPPADDRKEWAAISAVIAENDPNCRGILVLGLHRPLHDLVARFSCAREQSLCKGFAVGRSVFWDTADAWFAGTIGDDESVRQIRDSYERLSASWPADNTDSSPPALTG